MSTAAGDAAPLILHSHPLSSYCWKVLIALYECETQFEARLVNLGDPLERAAYLKLSPFGKIPVLEDKPRGRVILETSLIIEHLAMTLPQARSLLPADAAQAFEVRAKDRFYDLYLNNQMAKVVTDKLRPEGQRDPLGVAAARADMATALNIVETDMAKRTWAAGEQFSMADCAAAPTLHYTNRIMPFAASHPNAARYLDRLEKRPSFARVLGEAEPYFKMFPG